MEPLSDDGPDGSGDGEGFSYAALLDLSSDLILVTSANGILCYANRTARDALGIGNTDIQRLLLLDIVHPDNQGELGNIMREVTQQHVIREFASVFMTQSGDFIPVAGRMDGQQNADPPVRIRIAMRDLRSMQATNAASDEIEAQFRSAFDSPAIGMTVQGLDGRWQSVNNAFADIVGYSPTELLRMTFHDITYPDDLQPNEDLLQQLLSGTQRRFELEKRYVHRDGSILSVILNVSLVSDRAGKPLCFVSQIQDVTARKQLEAQLMHKASHDVLTGLPNRALFMDRLEHALARLQRDDGRVAVMFLDLDGFKAVNDQFSHEQGDRLLVEVGRRLRACARAGDTVARLGGDEFTILLEQVRHPSIATEVAHRVRHTLRYPILLGEHVTTISSSIGIAISTGSDDRAGAILHDADTAMYAAKRAGKDRAVLAQRDDNRQTT